MISQLPVSGGFVRARVLLAIRAFWLGVSVFLVCVPLFSQGNQGRITGTITDQSGGVVAGVTVTVKDVNRGVTRTLTTGDSGEYNAPNLLPGTYAVRAEAKGFKGIEQQNILLEVGKEIRVDLSLQPGEVNQTITITEAPPMVETTNATLGGTLSNETINDLPLNGRNYINLLTLRPGMNVYAGGGSFTRSANGTRAEDIGYLIDGLRNDDSYTGSSVLNAAIPAGDASTSLPIDAIQEFNTEQNPKAEFGWKPGAIVNAGIKSGTNTIHGTAFAFGRDTALDARNFYNAAPLTKSPIGLEQYGASLGGAIKKDKLFYFVNYEGQRYTVGDSLITNPPVTVAIPSAAGKNATPNPLCTNLTAGDCTQSLVDACNDLGFANVTPLSAHIAGLNSDCSLKPTNYTAGASESLFPPNPGTGALILGLVSTSAQDNGVAKVDYHINDHHSLSGMYFRGVGGGSWHDGAWEVGIPGSSDAPFISSLWGYIQAGSGAWTWVPNSTLVNELRVGYSYYRQDSDSNDSAVNPLAYGINTGVTDKRDFGFPLLQINSFNGANFRLGGNWPKHVGPDGSLQILDHVSILRGKHAFKFGGEIIRDTADPFITMNAKGIIKFPDLESFLLGNVRSNGSQIMSGDPSRHLSNQSYAAFVQDDWRVTPRLVVNLGLRYEVTTVFKDANNQLGNFDPSSPTGLVQVGVGGLSAPFHGDHNNFSPRVGFAWDVRGDGKTVIRGGGSIMYEEIPLITLTAVGNQLGLNLVPTGATQSYFPGDLTGNPGTGTLVTRAGPGNMGAIVSGVAGGDSATPDTPTYDWQHQTAGCVGGTTNAAVAACGTIFPTTVFALQCSDSVPCNTGAVDLNLRTPYISTWTLTVQRAITNDLSLEVAYVGNHGTKLLGFRDINQPPLGSTYPGFGSTDPTMNEVLACSTILSPAGFACDPGDANVDQTQRPFFNKFPYIGEIDRLSNQDKSNYNSMQVTLTERPTHGLSFLAGYTYAHALDAGSNNFNDIQLPPDSSHPTRNVYGNSLFDIRHRLTVSTTYAIPGTKKLGQLLQGWEVNSVVTLQSASPWGVQDFTNDFSGTNQVNEIDTFGQPWNFTGNPNDFKAGRNVPTPCWSGSGPSALPGCALTTEPTACLNAVVGNIGAQNTLNDVGCYAVGNSALTPPALGTVGNAGRDNFRDLGFKNWDLSVLKETKFKERLTAQFRAEFFNVLNHTNFSNPNGPANAGFNDPSTGNTGFFGCGCNTPDQSAPNPVLGTGGARSIQLGLKLIW